MRNISELIECYKQGIYTFPEVITAIVVEGASRDPSVLAQELPTQFLDGVVESVLALPANATADDVFVFKSSRSHAEAWFTGALNWKRYTGGQRV
ncbi:hypothetical protein ABL840_25720 [Variovorax sp. NFACC27]|uniref:hypothetical protein n=1 Tax=unclassified Variovorax TaxID=663243 RepID=UPI00115FF122